MGTHRYLTKSRFKLASECATKLHYTGDPAYFDSRKDDSFLAALAEGGFQVGALACLMEPGGVLIDERDAETQIARTRALLAQHEVVIYEATLAHEGLLVRVDILRKTGDVIDLIEVKAKSYSAAADGDFRAARGGFKSAWRPYLLDIAFQHHVARLALPHCEIRPWLMLADKDAVATVPGLGQAFKVRRQGRQIEVDVAPGTASRLGAPLLCKLLVASQVAELQAGALSVAGQVLPFATAIATLASAGRGELHIESQPSLACASCEFKTATVPEPGRLRSGFHECWSATLGWQPRDFEDGSVLDLWNSRRKAAWLAEGRYKLKQLTQDDFALTDDDPGAEGLSMAQRQWMQCKAQPLWFDASGFAREMAGWRFPLHFIDFETAMVPIPFLAGRKPYEVIAFQFSHHVMEADGSVRHATQFLEATPGTDPTRAFLRALLQALSGDEGTVFRWSHHENNVLCALRARLLEEQQAGDADLIDFIESITHGADREPGPRDMFDLCAVAQRRFYAPSTRGSSSLKKVLPALMRHSLWLRQTYHQPVYGSPLMPSLNLTNPMVWWRPNASGQPLDPYDLLPRIFTDLPADSLDALDADLSNDLQDGGAAMVAYARLQQELMPVGMRHAIEQALLRYCELDTLAMVMAVQAWKSWTGE
ncbi:DUF2779 domain-containing protein [Roseateles sp.]|uniref:DUF2779 domain-containing protein n=1 Tax=Roseateles sp. TaxID=1971397 RepID=UPI00392C323C